MAHTVRYTLPMVRQGRPSRGTVVLLLAALAAGAALRAFSVARARLWLDEYIMLELASLPTPADVVRGIAASNNTPVYPLLLHGLIRVAGDGPLAPRLISVCFGLLTLLLTARAALRRWGWPAAAIASTLVGLSAIAAHFSSEIRPYAILSFLFLASLEAFDASLRSRRLGPLLLQGLLIVLAIGLHPYGAALLAVGPLASLAVDRSAFRRQLGISAVSLAVVAPYFLVQLPRLPPEANEYLVDLWRGHGPLAPLGVLLRDVAPSAHWPSAIGPPASLLRGMLELASFSLIVAVAVASVIALRGRPDVRRDPYPAALTALLGVSALLALGGALIGTPVAVPGRFACALVAPFALLVAWASTLNAAARLCACGMAAVAVLATAEALAHPGPRGIRPELLAAAALRHSATRPALVITVGLTGLPLRYQLRNLAGLTFQPFPLELERHGTWWAPGHALRDPATLASDAERLARAAREAARSGRQVFIEGADYPVAASLREALGRSFRFRPISRYNRGLFELVPHPREVGRAAEARAERAGEDY